MLQLDHCNCNLNSKIWLPDMKQKIVLSSPSGIDHNYVLCAIFSASWLVRKFQNDCVHLLQSYDIHADDENDAGDLYSGKMNNQPSHTVLTADHGIFPSLL